MTRRGHLTCVAVITATVLCLGYLPMQMNPFAAVGVWIGSVVVIVMLACWLDELLYRHEQRSMTDRMFAEARRAMNERSMP